MNEFHGTQVTNGGEILTGYDEFAALRLDCSFDGEPELFLLEFRPQSKNPADSWGKDNARWHRAMLTVTQAGMTVRGYFNMQRDAIEHFVEELGDLIKDLEMPMQTAMLLEGDEGSGVVVGPLVPHSGVMFLDCYLNYDHHHSDRYERMRDRLLKYPSFDHDSRAGWKELRLSSKESPARVEETIQKYNYGPSAELHGLEIHRSQIEGIIRFFRGRLSL